MGPWINSGARRSRQKPTSLPNPSKLLADNELATGVKALIHGLGGRPELNGARVAITGWLNDKQRWRCKHVGTGELLAVKVDNLQRETAGRLPQRIFDALVACELDFVRAWLSSGGDIDAGMPAQHVNAGWTLLMCACHLGRADCAAELLGRHADVNARSHGGATALLVSLKHPSVLRILLECGAHTHLRWVGPSAEKDDGGAVLVPGTALLNAEKLGLEEAAALLREHERAQPPTTAPPRDVFELEVEILARVLAARLLADQAFMGDFKEDERRAWTQVRNSVPLRASDGPLRASDGPLMTSDCLPHQGRIRSAFADPADAAALSRRFSRHGDARLDLEHWERIAVAETVFLSRRSHFKQISEQTSDELPGFMEQLQMMTGFSAHKIPGNPFGKRADDD